MERRRVAVDQESGSPSSGRSKRSDPLDAPPRPIGPKRLALQARKHRQSFAAWRVGVTGCTSHTKVQLLTSGDGNMTFAVMPSRMGLLVERKQCPSSGQLATVTLVFDSVSAFDLWCDSEPVRFIDPRLHDQLRREGHAVLRTSR